MLFMLCTGPLHQSELRKQLVVMATRPTTAFWAHEEVISLLSWQPHCLNKKISPPSPLSTPPPLPHSVYTPPSPLSTPPPLPHSVYTPPLPSVYPPSPPSLCLHPPLPSLTLSTRPSALPLCLPPHPHYLSHTLSPTPYRPFASGAEDRTRASRFGGGVSTTALANGRCRG